MSNVIKSFDVLTRVFYIIILIQQNYFSDPAKILDLSSKSFFPCIYRVFSVLNIFIGNSWKVNTSIIIVTKAHISEKNMQSKIKI